MSNLFQLRLIAREIFDETLRAVDAGAALTTAVRIDGSRLSVGERSFELSDASHIYAIAIGKAAATMARALDGVLGHRLTAGIVAGPSRDAAARQLSKCWEYFEGGHPLPNEASLAAAKAALALLDRANKEEAVVIFLVSGGGSAMMEWPINDEITLEDLQNANRTLVNSGASISEINAVRRTFSAIKGGRLAARAPNCDQITLIVSDVPKRRERYVSSGPTIAPGKDAPQTAKIISRFNLRDQLPASIVKVVYKPAPPQSAPIARREHFLLLENTSAVNEAFAEACERGFTVDVAHNISDQPIDIGCKKLLDRLKSLRSLGSTGKCLISGGEFACPVHGGGLGGRNLETALRLAILAEEHRNQMGEFVALCAGTDGIDGTSPAAGAIIDSTTIERARRIGLDPIDFLNRSDSYSFFVALGDVITTGPTGTNVRDLRVLLASAQTS